jgi:hypothetical protein
VSNRLRSRLRSGQRLPELFKLFVVCIDMQRVFDMHGRICSRSILPV